MITFQTPSCILGVVECFLKLILPVSLTCSPHAQGYKVFVGGIHLETSKDTLRDYFEQFGNLTDAVVMRDGMTDKSRGFGFVTYESEEERNACINGKPHILDGKEVSSFIP